MKTSSDLVEREVAKILEVFDRILDKISEENQTEEGSLVNDKRSEENGETHGYEKN